MGQRNGRQAWRPLKRRVTKWQGFGLDTLRFWGQLPSWWKPLESTAGRQYVGGGGKWSPSPGAELLPAEGEERPQIYLLPAFPLYEPIVPLLSVLHPLVGVNFLTQTLAFSLANAPNTSKAHIFGLERECERSIGQPIPWGFAIVREGLGPTISGDQKRMHGI